MNIQHNYQQEEPTDIAMESDKAFKQQQNNHIFPTIDLEDENASEEEIASEQDSEYLREKER